MITWQKVNVRNVKKNTFKLTLAFISFSFFYFLASASLLITILPPLPSWIVFPAPKSVWSSPRHLVKSASPLAPGRCLGNIVDIVAVVVCLLLSLLLLICFVCFFLVQHSCLCDTLVSIYMRLCWSRCTLRIAWIEKGRGCLLGLSGYCPHVTVLVLPCLWKFCFLTKK